MKREVMEELAMPLDSRAQEILLTVAHELRTPLNAIASWARMLEEGELSPEQQRRAIAAIRRCAAAQARLIEDLVDGTRGANDGLRIRHDRIDIATVVSGALACVERMAERKQIEVDVRVPQSSFEILGDLHRLEQVVCSLLVNAVKFSPHDSRIEVNVEQRGAFVALCVRDHGMGIRRDCLPHFPSTPSALWIACNAIVSFEAFER
jgi:signal transduction histidine kinase